MNKEEPLRKHWNREQAWGKYLSEGGKQEHKEAFYSGWFFARQRHFFEEEEEVTND